MPCARASAFFSELPRLRLVRPATEFVWESAPVGCVVSGKNAEPADWFRIESRVQDVSPSSHPSITPHTTLIYDRPDSASCGPDVALLSRQDVSNPQIEQDSSQRRLVAARQEIAFVDPSIFRPRNIRHVSIFSTGRFYDCHYQARDRIY